MFVAGCGAFHRHPLEQIAIRDLDCPPAVPGTRGRMMTPVRIAHTIGASWIATCAGRTARYECHMSTCRRTDLPRPTETGAWLTAGPYECRGVGTSIEGDGDAAAAVGRLAEDLVDCHRGAFIAQVVPLIGELHLDPSLEEVPASEAQCLDLVLRTGRISPAPPTPFLLACRLAEQ